MTNFSKPQDYTFIFKYFDVTKQKFCTKIIKERHRPQYIAFSANNMFVTLCTMPNIRNVLLTVFDKEDNIVWECVK